MKILKIILIVSLIPLAVALIYPGIPVGGDLESNMSTRYAVVHCYYLHWTGLRARDVDVSSQIKNGGISMTNEDCRRWDNWDPMK